MREGYGTKFRQNEFALRKDGIECGSADNGREEEKPTEKREWGSRLRIGGDSWPGYKRDIAEKEVETSLTGGDGRMGKRVGKTRGI